MDNLTIQSNMEHLELDEIVRLISKKSWERFQVEMEKLEYQRRNSDLEHRIKMLRLQLNVPQVTISKNLPCHNTIDPERFGLELHNAFQLNELKRDKIATIEKNYHRKVEEIHKNSNEIIGKFENLAIVKKKRYFENEIHSVRQEIVYFENCIAFSKQQLNETRCNHDKFVHNFILESVINWKSITILQEQIQSCGHRMDELCNETGITLNDVVMMENHVAEIRKVYEQLKMEQEFINSQLPKVIAKLPLTYNSFEQGDDIIDRSLEVSPSKSIPSPKRLQIIENILVKPADKVTQSQSIIETDEHFEVLDDVQSQQCTINQLNSYNNVTVQLDSTDIKMYEEKPPEIRKTEKSKKPIKRSNAAVDDKQISSFAIENHSNLKKMKITADREIVIGKKVEFNTVSVSSLSPRKLRSHKPPTYDSSQKSQKEIPLHQPNEMDEVEQLSQTFKKLSPKHVLDVSEVDSCALKCLSPVTTNPNLSIFSTSGSFLVNPVDQEESICVSTDSKDDDFFITNEGAHGFDFFQTNDKKDPFAM